MLQSNDASFGFYRSALKSAVDMTALYLSSVERLQSAQAEAFRDICAEQAEVASKLESIQSIEELQTVQSGYTRHQMERLGDYWRGLFTNTCQSQMEFLKEAQAKARQATDSLNQNLDSTQNLPAVSAIKMFVDAAHSAYAAGLRVTEQAAVMTATQMDAGKNAAAAAIGQVNGKSRRAAA